MKKTSYIIVFILLIGIVTSMEYIFDDQDYDYRFNIYNVSNLTGDQVTSNNFIGVHSGNTSIWNRSGTNVILSNTGDNVGIGIIDPTNKLHVIGDANITESLFSNEFTILATADSEYKFFNTYLAGILDLQNQVSGKGMWLNLATADEDGTDIVYFVASALQKRGTFGAVNKQDMISGWDKLNDEFTIKTEIGGTGVLKNISLYTHDNRGMLTLRTDGNIGVGNDIHVTGTSYLHNGRFEGEVNITGAVGGVQADAQNVLIVSGGKGGDASDGGAGKGSNIVLTAGAGGDDTDVAIPGKGGDITLTAGDGGDEDFGGEDPSADGGDIILIAGQGGSAGDERGDGGDIRLIPGTIGVGGGTPSYGDIILNTSNSQTRVLGDLNVTGTNATFEQDITVKGKIHFAFGEIIDNLVDGIIQVTGILKVTGQIRAESYRNSSGDLEWIKPENILDVDKEDIETDLNTFVDIDGDVMTGTLQMGTNLINGSGNISSSQIILQMNTSLMVCNNNNAGSMYYDNGTNKFYGCNSTAWSILND